MKKSYIPKAEEKKFCEGIKLCSVRKTKDGISKIGIKKINGKLSEGLLVDVINSETYKGKKIVRVYSSGHVFISENLEEVFLVTTEKKGKIQHQFTGGSPLEDGNKKVIFEENGNYKFDIEKVRNNARIRTKNRTGVEVLEEYNEQPLVDWVLMENEEGGEIYYKLICLMHFIVKKYNGELKFSGNENTIDGKFYNIEKLLNTENVSANAYIVSKKAVELIKKNKI